MRMISLVAPAIPLALSAIHPALARDALVMELAHTHFAAAQPSESPTVSAPSPFDVGAIGEGELRHIAGREDTTQVSHADQVAGVSRNSVGDNSVTGEAKIDGNAFQNMSGLSILNVNTGNNVAINAAMNVNVSITQGP